MDLERGQAHLPNLQIFFPTCKFSQLEWLIPDAQIIEQLMSGEERQALPLFGCAVSQQLRSKLNPLAKFIDSI